MSVGANPQTLLQSWNVPDLKKRLLFVLQALVIFTIGTHIPAPGISHQAVTNFFGSAGAGDLFGLFDLFSGGALKKLSIFALGIMPYINASIMMQILVAVEPRLKQIQQEGEEGRKRISKWTRYLAVALAFLQGSGLLAAIYGSVPNTRFIIGAAPTEILPQISALLAVVGGTCFLMWLSDEISQKGVGNGTSIIIMIGIIASIPGQIWLELSQAALQQRRIVALLLMLILAIVVV